MPRRAHYVPLPWVRIDRTLGLPAERQLSGALRQAIRQGLLPYGFRLPSVRQLAMDLDVSRRVIANAYERLEAEGYVASNRGAGTHVAAEAVLPRRTSACIAPSLRAHSMPRGAFAADSTLPLRELIATRLCPSRGIFATAEEIVLASHREEAIACAARLLADPGDGVRIDGNPRTAALYEHFGLRLVEEQARIIHHATALAPGQQYLLLKEARSTGAAIVEEAHGGRSLKSLDGEGRVVYVDSLFLIVPQHLAALAANLIPPPPRILQSTFAECIARGHSNVTLQSDLLSA
jgi:DNA-binding transcriptional regulator YhcF (GntR family)